MSNTENNANNHDNEINELKEELQALQTIVNNQSQYIEQLENSLSLRIGRRLDFLFRIKQKFIWSYRKLKRSKIIKKFEKRFGIKLERKPKYKLLPKKTYDLSSKTSDSLKVASILDEFSFNCFKYEMDLYHVPNKDYIQMLDELKPDLFFIESAWKGSNGQWKVGHKQNYGKMVEITNYCKDHDIPTLFWCKEDPVHFEHFIHIAKLFDYVFTTDANMINEYKRRCGHDDVYALPFAAQPQIHNPIKEYDRENRVCFAGSYYRQKYQDRAKILRMMLSASKNELGLDIYDRNYNSGIDNYKFPDEYKENVRGVLPYEQISKAYKGYKVNINVNTVTESPTMFSRRVFESLACNTPIISNYSRGVQMMFSDLINMSEDENEYANYLSQLCNSELFYQQVALKGLRKVMNNHTYIHRTKEMLSKMYLDLKIDRINVTFVIKTDSIKKAIQLFDRQNYPFKKLIIITDLTEKVNEYHDNVYLLKISNQDKIMDVIKNSDYIGLLDESAYYGNSYITDLVHTLTYKNVDIISKSNNIIYESEEFKYIASQDEYTDFKENANLYSSLISTKVITANNFEDYLNNELDQKHLSKFRIDSFNFWSCTENITLDKLEQIIEV